MAYMILWNKDGDTYLTHVANALTGSIRLFDSIKKANSFINKHKDRDNMRLISIKESER